MNHRRGYFLPQSRFTAESGVMVGWLNHRTRKAWGGAADIKTGIPGHIL
jgi:hypothetical protein